MFCKFAAPVCRPGRVALCVAAALVTGLPARADDPFERLNEAFRQQHAEAREREWSRRGPVILVEFDKLTLITGDDRKSAEVVPPLYHRLKSVSHAPLAVCLALGDGCDAPINDRQRAELKEIASRVEAVRGSLETAGFDADALQRQRDILDRTATFIADTLRTGSAGAKELRDFARGVRRPVMRNAVESAEVQIRAYDAQVALWQEAYPKADWGKLKVVVTGSALPRKGNLATQYFARLLGVPGEGPRLVYAEGLYEEAKVLRLLNTTAVDARAAELFFDDPDRLNRDLLSDAAASFLRQHGSELKAKVVAGRP
jgi:hypothetical protein